MEKQVVIQNIELEQLSMESIVEGMGYGNSILFVTEEKKLIGAVTEGDINRYFRSGKNILDGDVINRNIRYIVDEGDFNQVCQEAERLFGKYQRVHNIPVVDDGGMLLYQMNRSQNVMLERIKEYLTRINEHKALPIFFMCEGTNHIVIAGGSKSTLIWVKNWFELHIEMSGLNNKVTVSILENVAEYHDIPKESVVICLSDIVLYYLRTVLQKGAKILAVREISQYYFYKELETIHTETVLDYFKLFGYDKICIHNRNIFMDEFIDKIQQCGITVVDKKEYSNVNILQTDIFVYSGDGTYEEKILPDGLYLNLYYLQIYRLFAGKALEREFYIQEYIGCMECVTNKGYWMCIQPHNPLEEEIYQQINVLQRMHIENLEGKQYVSVQRSAGFERKFNFTHNSIIYTIVINTCCRLMQKTCNHVYLLLFSFTQNPYKLNINRTITNYMENKKEYFSLDFDENMYGDKDYPVRQLLLDMEGCSIYEINEGYQKYQSNYRSKFFNTDTYGCRVTIDAPQNYSGTIWLMGACGFSGYAVEDCDTIASILQKKINQAGINYRIVNLSMNGSHLWTQINRLFEMGVQSNDIIIGNVDSVWNQKDEDTILVDADGFISQLGDDEYWNIPTHCGVKGNAMLADRIFEGIKKDFCSYPKKIFSLEDKLEKEVNAYIADVKKRIAKEDIKNIDMHNKAGAIVMNCNPFTYGHQYLVETASRLVDVLYIFVVEEDKSVFPFLDRMHMVEEGTKAFSNVIVLPSGKFMISSVTFPGYFMKENPDRECFDSFLDLKIFAHYIAPALEISMRFVGEEPFDRVTAQYNHDMKLILGDQDVGVIEIPRKKFADETISATKVRQLMGEGNVEMLLRYVPESTMKYIQKFM